MSLLSALGAGILFGLGLAVSGMADPEKVLAFLVIGPEWDPALMLVMGSALGVTATGYALIQKRSSPIWADTFGSPTATHIDRPLVLGAALFGFGWGLSGYCPGPAIVGSFVVDVRALAFLAAFLIGLSIFELSRRVRTQNQIAGEVDG